MAEIWVSTSVDKRNSWECSLSEPCFQNGPLYKVRFEMKISVILSGTAPVSFTALLSGAFVSLHRDQVDVIVPFLDTLDTHVLSNTTLPRSSKVKLFNQSAMKEILAACNWKGQGDQVSHSFRSVPT